MTQCFLCSKEQESSIQQELKGLDSCVTIDFDIVGLQVPSNGTPISRNDSNSLVNYKAKNDPKIIAIGGDSLNVYSALAALRAQGRLEMPDKAKGIMEFSLEISKYGDHTLNQVVGKAEYRLYYSSFIGWKLKYGNVPFGNSQEMEDALDAFHILWQQAINEDPAAADAGKRTMTFIAELDASSFVYEGHDVISRVSRIDTSDLLNIGKERYGRACVALNTMPSKDPMRHDASSIKIKLASGPTRQPAMIEGLANVNRELWGSDGRQLSDICIASPAGARANTDMFSSACRAMSNLMDANPC